MAYGVGSSLGGSEFIRFWRNQCSCGSGRSPPVHSGMQNAEWQNRKIGNPHTCYHCRHVARKPSSLSLALTKTSWPPRRPQRRCTTSVTRASVRRSHHDYRLAVTGNSPAQLMESLEAFLRGEARPGLSSGRRLSASPAKTCFCVSGARVPMVRHGATAVGAGSRLSGGHRTL